MIKNKCDDVFIDEAEIDLKIRNGLIVPVKLPEVTSFSETFKFNLCSEIIKYKKIKNYKNIDLGNILRIDKSEVSRLCSYSIKDFSIERLLYFFEEIVRIDKSFSLEDLYLSIHEKIKAHQNLKRNFKPTASSFPFEFLDENDLIEEKRDRNFKGLRLVG